MSDFHSQVDPPRRDSPSDEQRNTSAEGVSSLPAWNRERLIEQFQQIDSSTRSEAERQVVAFEQSFGSRIADPPGDGPPQASPRK